MNIVIAAALLCLILPALLLAGGIFVSGLRYKRTVGTIVGQHTVDGETQQLSAPIVEFATPDGRKITLTEKVHSSESIFDILGNLVASLAFKKDLSRVPVLYDPNDPQKARVSTLANLYMLPIVLFAFGIVVMLSTLPGFGAALGKVTAFLDKIPF